MHQVPVEVRRGHRIHRDRVTDEQTTQPECRELNLGLVEEQQVLLTDR